MQLVLGLIVLAVIGLVILVARRPSEYSVSRSAHLPARPDAVFPEIENFHKWDAWSPWAKIDPDAKVAYEGPESGEGASMTWDGNKEVGSGKMTITKADEPKHIEIRLEFFKPFKGVSTVEFKLEPHGDTTFTTWQMQGTNNFVGKFFDLFMSCEKMIGAKYEEGLANLAKVVEAKHTGQNVELEPVNDIQSSKKLRSVKGA